MIITALLSFNFNFVAADSIGQNRLGNNRYILNHYKGSQRTRRLPFEIMLEMSKSKAGEQVLKNYFRALKPKKANTSRLALYRGKFGY